MATVIDSLLIRLGFDADTSGAASFETGLGSVIKTAGKVGAVLAGVGVAAAGFLGKGVLDAASQFEQFRTQLTTIEGDSEKAEKSLSWIRDFAKRTPYELAGVTDAFVKLKAYGFDPTTGLLEDLGNAASGLGKDIMVGVEAIADAINGENERLKEAFNIKARVDKKSGTTDYTYTNNKTGEQKVKTVTSGDKVEIEAALRDILQENYAGGMDAMAKTWAGTISNMKDAYNGFLLGIADAGVFDTLKDGLGKLATWIENNQDKIANFALAIAEGFKIAIATVVAIYDAVSAAYNWLNENMQTIINTIKTIAVIAGVIGTALLIMYAPAIAGFLVMQAIALASFIAISIGAIAAAVATAAAWVIAFAPFLLIGAVIAVVIALLWTIYNNAAQIAAGISAEWQKLMGVFSSVAASISAVWSGLWASVKAMASGAIDFVISKVQGLISMISGALSSITKISNFKMPSFSVPKIFGGGGKGGGGNTSSVNQTFNVSSASAASSIARNSVGAQRRSNTGVKQ